MNSLMLRVLGIVFLVVCLVGAAAYMFRKPVYITEVAPKSSTIPAYQDVPTAAKHMAEFNLFEDGPIVPAVPMHDENGKTVTIEAYRGKVVLLNMWATWCPPCIAEMPGLHALHKQYQDRGFIVLPVASGEQGKEDPAEFLRRREMTAFETLYDPQSMYLRTFNLDTLPTTLIIDRTGKLRGGVAGMANWQSDAAKGLIEAFLSEG